MPLEVVDNDVAAYHFTRKKCVNRYGSNESDGSHESSQRHTLEWRGLEVDRSYETISVSKRNQGLAWNKPLPNCLNVFDFPLLMVIA